MLALELWMTRHSWLSPGERLLFAAVVVCTFFALSVVKLPRCWFALPLLLLWPVRWYPLVRFALSLLLVSPLKMRPRFAPIFALAAFLLLQISSNLRFVAFEQSPISGPLLDGVSRLLPTPEAPARATTHRGPRLSLPALGDAHILLITVDALRADRPLHLPEGIRFTHAYAQFPSTARSITTLLTGGGKETLAEKWSRWHTEAFYPAGLFFDGRNDLERYARTRFGFHWADTRTQRAEALTDAVLQRLQQEGEPRSFFWVHYFDTHEPYRDGSYDRAVEIVDREIQRLLDGTKQLKRPVIVCITADHGEEFGDHGGRFHNSSLYEEQIHVPLIILGAGVREIDEPVALEDVAAMLLALAGEGEPPAFHDVFAQVASKRMIVRGNRKLIHDLRRDVDELYDLANDPHELHPLADRTGILGGTAASERLASLADRDLRPALDAHFNLSTPAELERRLAGGDPAAARELGELEAFDSRPALRKALSDARVRPEAALALGEMTDHQALDPLLELLNEDAYRHRAALMLGRLRDARAIPVLVETLRDIDPTHRRHAAHYLGFLGAPDCIPLLFAAATDARVRDEAQLAIARILSAI
jgi:hypothetical protein